jgi:hypothetical protein
LRLLQAQRAPTLDSMSRAVIRLWAIALWGACSHAWAAGDGLVPPVSGLSVSEQDQRLAGIRGRDDVLLRNADAVVGARLWLRPGSGSSAFVYADVGATNSAVRWQGLAGIHGGHGIDLVGGWRRVTYHYAPGAGFDSLDFDGPFLGATLAL